MVSRRNTKERTKRRNWAVQTLQRVYRGHQGKRRFWEIHGIKSAASRVIQHNVRAWLIGHLVDRRIQGKKHLAATMQRVGRGRFGRLVAQQLRFKRDTIAATKIQGLLRGRMGRKRWVQIFRDKMAMRIQNLVRSRQARKRTEVLRIERAFRTKRNEIRLKCFMRRVKKRSKAARQLQRMFRGHVGRNLYLDALRIDRAIRLQRWMRSIFIHRVLHTAVHSMVRCYRFYNKLVYPRLGVLQHYLYECRDVCDTLCNDSMNECRQVLARDLFFTGEEAAAEEPDKMMYFLYTFGWRSPKWPIPERWLKHKERLRLMKYMLENKALLRKIFLRSSMVLVSAPEKCFKLSKAQFEKLLRDTGLNKEVNSNDIDVAWTDSRKPVPKKVNIATNASGKKSIQGRGAKKANKGGEDTDVTLSQFLDLIMRVTLMVTAAEDADGNKRGITDRFKQLVEERLVATIEGFTIDEFVLEEGTLNEIKKQEEVKAVLASYHPRLKRFYKRFGGTNKSGNDDMDIVEFMLSLNQAKCIDSKLSNARGLEIFVRCNQSEVKDYLTAMPDDMRVLDMSCSFDEFVDCVIVCADSQRKKNDSVAPRLGTFIERMLTEVQIN